MLKRTLTLYICWTLTDEELKQMKKVLMIAPWTALYLWGDEKIRNEKERRNEKRTERMNR